MKAVLLRKVKKGDYFTLTNKVKFVDDVPYSEVQSKYVYVKGDYNRADKDYTCHKFEDVCHERFLKGDRIVYVDFMF